MTSTADVAGAVGKGLFAGAAGTVLMTISSTATGWGAVRALIALADPSPPAAAAPTGPPSGAPRW